MMPAQAATPIPNTVAAIAPTISLFIDFPFACPLLLGCSCNDRKLFTTAAIILKQFPCDSAHRWMVMATIVRNYAGHLR